MGTKEKIAPAVAAVIAQGPSGPLLDVFSGVCAIASAVGPTRQVWCNDIQIFASSVAKAFFACTEPPLAYERAADISAPLYRQNYLQLENRFRGRLKHETEALATKSYSNLVAVEKNLANASISDAWRKERRQLATNPLTAPYRLFSITFAGGYVGIKQALQIDSIRYAVDLTPKQREKVAQSYDDYKNKPSMGVVSLTETIEGLARQAARDAHKKNWVSKKEAEGAIAGSLDAMFKASQCQNARAAIGGIRNHIANYRNLGHHWPKNKKLARKKYLDCRHAFLDGMRQMVNFRKAMRDLGLSGNLPKV